MPVILSSLLLWLGPPLEYWIEVVKVGILTWFPNLESYHPSSIFKYNISCRYSKMLFIRLMKFLSVLSLLRVFSMKKYWIMSYFLLPLLRWCFLFPWWIAWIYFWLLNQLCIPEINPILFWGWICWLWCANILLRIFTCWYWCSVFLFCHYLMSVSRQYRLYDMKQQVFYPLLFSGRACMYLILLLP